MKTLIIILATLGLTTAAWADCDDKPRGKHHDKPPFGKMMLKQMDQNDDGIISEKEHEDALQKMVEKRRAHFKMMDKDDDGLVTKEEAKEAREQMGEKRKERKKERMDD
jgi:Ca2+-binding EF-hand superfamily protein